jgi:hypothetical protein
MVLPCLDERKTMHGTTDDDRIGKVGDFRFLSHVADHAISVRLCWVDGQRKGELCVPPAVLEDLQANALAVPGGIVAIEVAAGFGVFVAMSTGMPLYFTGDRSVWSGHWGALHLSS